MNKICSSCIFNNRLNERFPCIRCVNNELNRNKTNLSFHTSIGMYKFRLKNYYTEKGADY